MSRISAFVVAIVILTASNPIEAGIITLDNTKGGLGDLLDGIQPIDLGTHSAGPIAVPGLDPLNIIVVGLSAIGDGEILNSTSASLGINSESKADATARFDSIFDEHVTFEFDQAVLISQLDFTHFDKGEVFEFAGVTIDYNDLSSKSKDVYDFASPLMISANTSFSLRATSGVIGIEALDVSLQNTTVPEPSSMAIFTMLGFGFVAGRKRQLVKQEDLSANQ